MGIGCVDQETLRSTSMSQWRLPSGTAWDLKMSVSQILGSHWSTGRPYYVSLLTGASVLVGKVANLVRFIVSLLPFY